MKPEIITAIIAAVVAVISATITIYGQARVAQLTDRLAQRRETESREAQTNALMSRYRDPLLRSAIDLQSRLFNIYQNDFLYLYYDSSQAKRNYAIQNTLYVIAEYLGWVEIMRREVQFFDLGDIERNRRLSKLLVNINRAFAVDSPGQTFQLYTGEQRAIGEIMRIPQPVKDFFRYECMGYAQFVKELNNPDFSVWFIKLKDDIDSMANKQELNRERLVMIHSNLIDLIDFLDPDYIRIEAKRRTKIK